MIEPVNGHLVIEPVKRESFVPTGSSQYQEVGVVVAYDPDCGASGKISLDDKVYFDSWLAAKYPKGDDEFYWLVKWEDVRAIEHVE